MNIIAVAKNNKLLPCRLMMIKQIPSNEFYTLSHKKCWNDSFFIDKTDWYNLFQVPKFYWLNRGQLTREVPSLCIYFLTHLSKRQILIFIYPWNNIDVCWAVKVERGRCQECQVQESGHSIFNSIQISTSAILFDRI